MTRPATGAISGILPFGFEGRFFHRFVVLTTCSLLLVRALVHESELARNEPDSQVHHLPRAYDDGLQGDAGAQSSLGSMYAVGEGVPEDYVKAYVWANLAAAQGDEDAVRLKVELRPKMSVEQVAEAQKLSDQLFKRLEASALDLPKHDRSSMYHRAEPIYRIGEGVTPPTLIYKREPAYSEAARNAKLQGTVLLSAIVRKDGSLESVKVLRGLGLGLDEKAIAALMTWRFRPGMKGGRPVDVAVNIEVNFRLL